MPDANKETARSIDLSYLGCSPSSALRNLSPAVLIELALDREGAKLSDKGTLIVDTRPFTGRTPNNRFIVDSPEIHDEIAWGNVNRAMSVSEFESMWKRAMEYVNGREMFVFDGIAGADRRHSKKIRTICELPSQCLFATQMLIRPEAHEFDDFGNGDYTLIALPGFKDSRDIEGGKVSATVAIDLATRRILVAGTRYSGEIKKAIFSAMSFELTNEGVLPMHCSASVDRTDGSVAAFFGLSGTGKTTLSADPSRSIIGDDEHGWGDEGIFNLEGGCYAKCIDLTDNSEPEIYDAIRFGAISENVILDPTTRAIDFSDGSITDNTRAAYPIYHIKDSVASGMAKGPNTIFFLTADAFGVLPPISRLSPESAMFHFASGFTSKVAGTEFGIDDPVPAFSSLFGEPFMPRPVSVYVRMLEKHIKQEQTEVFLVNTGWIGGSASEGASRIPLAYTRAMVSAACKGELRRSSTMEDKRFGLQVILEAPGVPKDLLNPQEYWVKCGSTKERYDQAAERLAGLFRDNFKNKFEGQL